jgi:hypothetical protein
MLEYLKCIELLMEYIGLHPRRTHDEEVVEALRGKWRPFVVEKVK